MEIMVKRGLQVRCLGFILKQERDSTNEKTYQNSDCDGYGFLDCRGDCRSAGEIG